MATRKVIDPEIITKRRILRFWAWVDRSGGDDACWPWLGSVSDSGHGVVCFLGERTTAHRIAYELYTGEKIPKGMRGRHTCDNPPCCNPRHTVPGTQKQNLTEMRDRGRGGDTRNFGEKHGRCIITDVKVAEMRHRYEQDGVTQRQLAEEYKISRSHVFRILKGLNRSVSSNRQSMIVIPYNKKPGRPKKLVAIQQPDLFSEVEL